jgi:hypothetical protein
MPQQRHLGDSTKSRVLFTQLREPGHGNGVMNVIAEGQRQPDVGINQSSVVFLGSDLKIQEYVAGTGQLLKVGANNCRLARKSHERFGW